MAVTKTIEIDGKQVKFKASAAVPRLYRIKFGRDIYKDLRMLEKSVGDNDEDASNMDLFSLELFEDLAWLMARHASPRKCRITRRTSWTSSTPSLSTRSFPSSSTCGG